MKVPLMLLPLEDGARLAKRWSAVTGVIVKAYPRIRIDLVESELGVNAEGYVGASIFSSILTGAIMAGLIFLVLLALRAELSKALLLSLMPGAATTLLFAIILLIYPGIIAGKKAEDIDKDLVFALKDMLLEVSSGASVYSALVEVSRSGYGSVSVEFEKVVKKVNVGIPVEDALGELALKTKSEHLRSSIWQIVNAIKSGSSTEGVLRELVKEMTVERRTKIKSYAQELNVMVLAYMLFAVVIPTIATTVVIILGPFLGVDVGPRVFYIILPVCFFIQLALVELVKSRRPQVYL